jgi:hypothetical protein
MRNMVLDTMHLTVKSVSAERPSQGIRKRSTGSITVQPVSEEFPIGAIQGCVEEFSPHVRPGIGIDGDDIDFIEHHSRFIETISDCPYGQSRPVLDSIESLLFCSRNQIAVSNKTRTRISVKGVDANYDSHLTVSRSIRAVTNSTFTRIVLLYLYHRLIHSLHSAEHIPILSVEKS